MTEIKLKNYTLKYNPEDPYDIFGIPDPNSIYKCSRDCGIKGFDYIHKIVMLTGKHPEALAILEEYLAEIPGKINCQNRTGWTPLKLACLNSRTDSTEETVEFLLSHPAIDINLQSINGGTALIMACRSSNIESTERTVELLLAHPAINVNLQDKDGLTALHWACRNSGTYSTERTVEILLAHSAIYVNLRDKDGLTALHWACQLNKIQIVRMVLNYSNIV